MDDHKELCDLQEALRLRQRHPCAIAEIACLVQSEIEETVEQHTREYEERRDA